MPKYSEMEEDGENIPVKQKVKTKYEKILFYGIIVSLFLTIVVLIGTLKSTISELEIQMLNQTRKFENVQVETNKELVSIVEDGLDKTEEVIEKIDQGQRKGVLKIQTLSFDIQETLVRMNTSIREKESQFFDKIDLIRNITESNSEILNKTRISLEDLENEFTNFISSEKKTNLHLKEFIKNKIENQTRQVIMKTTNFIETYLKEFKTEDKKIKKKTEDDLSSQNIVNSKINEEITKVKLGNLTKDTDNNTNCKQGWTKYLSKCYKMVERKRRWSETLCQSEGGSLVIIKDVQMNDFIISLTKGNYAWLGGNDIKAEGVWEWVDGTHMEKNFGWKSGGPTNWKWAGKWSDCLRMGVGGEWNDYVCFQNFYYVCETEL